ncbi:gamma-glutamylcyclotransferase family protein [Aquipuribacter hungaricus]|uniref:Gamma-glutamylcyclotransferase n=1 Tax=Aquipuribacter hungaricus TaxID=545624 RepID=A0ABV7WB58_9MICO
MTGTLLVPVAGRRTPLLLAVYGTLRRGCRNAGVLAGCRHLGDGEVAGTLHEVSVPREQLGYGYPLLVLDDAPGPAGAGGRVRVEVYGVDDPATLLALDELEDYDPDDPSGSEYVRVVVPLLSGWPGAPEQVQVYVHAGEPSRRGPVLPGGDWYLHAGERA